MLYRLIKYILFPSGLVFLALLVWAFYIEPSSLTTKTYEVAVRSWPTSCDRLKVAVIADLHIGSPYSGIEKLVDVVDAVNQSKPDLILIAGDFVITGVLGGRFVAPEPIAQELGKLTANLGVFAVLGNHDWMYDADRVRQSLLTVGISVLEDDSVQIDHDRCHFWLVGISDYWEGSHDIDKGLRDVPTTGSVIALTHNPDVFVDIPDQVSMTFAGHTHGGQVNLPFIGRPVIPSRYRQRFAVGHIEENGRHLFVSPGLGTSIYPIRFRVPPEISLAILRGG